MSEKRKTYAFVFGDRVTNKEAPEWGICRFVCTHPVKTRDESTILIEDGTQRYCFTSNLEPAEALRRPVAGYLVRAGYEQNKGSFLRHEENGFVWRAARGDATVFSMRALAEEAASAKRGEARIVPTRRKS